LCDASQRGFHRRARAQRFVMIRDGNPGALRPSRTSASPQAIPEVWPKPEFCVSGELHGIGLPWFLVQLT
jgi:hypothetical protein